MRASSSFLAGLLPALLFIAVAAGLATPSRARADTPNADQARAELSTLENRIDALRQRMAATSGKRSALDNQLNQVQEEIGKTRHRLAHLNSQIAAHKKRIAKLTAERDRQRQHLSGQLGTLRAQITAAYENGQVSPMRVLLSGQSPARIGRLLEYYRYFSEAQAKQVSELKDQLAVLVAKQDSLTAEKQQLAVQRNARRQTLTRLEAGEKQEKSTIAALDARLSSQHGSLADMKHQAAALKKLLSSVQSQLSHLPPVPQGVPLSHLKGRMHAPVSGPLIASFGQYENGGPLRWQGDWFAAPQGTPVHAIAGGQVVYVGYLKGYGLIVIIDDGHNYYTVYGHAAASYVNVGDAVSTGQPIATAGHSGGHDRSGIYLEIRRGQTPINPTAWLDR